MTQEWKPTHKVVAANKIIDLKVGKFLRLEKTKETDPSYSDLSKYTDEEGDIFYLADYSVLALTSTSTTGIKNDSGKRQWWYMDSFWPDLEQVVDVLEYGDTKYPASDGSNWKRLENPEKRFKDALFRHMVAYRLGEKTDSETGKSHLAHLITNALILMYFDRQEQEAQYDQATLDKVLDVVEQVRGTVHYSNSPYGNNEEIVNPFLDAVANEVEYLKKGN